MFIRAVVWGDNEIINENEDEKLGAVNLWERKKEFDEMKIMLDLKEE
jgi:hypothetical protein